jgi:hypothetical protein
VNFQRSGADPGNLAREAASRQTVVQELWSVAIAPIRSARSVFMTVLFIEVARTLMVLVLGAIPGLGMLRNLVSIVATLTILHILVSCLRETGLTGRAGVGLATHDQAPGTFAAMALVVLGPPLAVLLLLLLLSGWDAVADWGRLSGGWQVTVAAIGFVWAVTLPMSLILISVRGAANDALDPFRLLGSIWMSGRAYLGTWVSCALAGAALLVIGSLAIQVPLLGPWLASGLILYFLVAFAWAFGSLAWRQG